MNRLAAASFALCACLLMAGCSLLPKCHAEGGLSAPTASISGGFSVDSESLVVPVATQPIVVAEPIVKTKRYTEITREK